MLTIAKDRRGGLVVQGSAWGWDFRRRLADAGALYDKLLPGWKCGPAAADAVRLVVEHNNRMEGNFFTEQRRLESLWRKHGSQKQAPIPEQEAGRARALINAAAWRTSRSQDHQYTLRNTWTPRDGGDADFCWLVLWIRQNGVIIPFYGRYYLKLHLDQHQYWSMGDELVDTSLINRALAKAKPREAELFDNVE